jgi:hypothetical protein
MMRTEREPRAHESPHAHAGKMPYARSSQATRASSYLDFFGLGRNRAEILCDDGPSR